MQVLEAFTLCSIGHLQNLDCDSIEIAGLPVPADAAPFFRPGLNPIPRGGKNSAILEVSADDSISSAVRNMIRNSKSALIVRSSSGLGIVTDRDLWRRRTIDPNGKVGDICTRTLECADIELPLAYAIYMVVYSGVRHIPIFIDDQLWRISSANDLARFIYDLCWEKDRVFLTPLHEVIRKGDRDQLKKFSVPSYMSMEAAAEQASRLNAGGFLVIDDDELVGVVSERDNVRRLDQNISAQSEVREWMTPRSKLVVVQSHENLAEAIRKMVYHHIRHLVVQFGDYYRIVGIRRLLAGLAEVCPDIANLPHTALAARGYCFSEMDSGSEGGEDG